jgi:hypothetical protein
MKNDPATNLEVYAKEIVTSYVNIILKNKSNSSLSQDFIYETNNV